MNSCCLKRTAALLGLFLAAGCTDPSTPPAGDAGHPCQSGFTPISAIQGDGRSSPRAGSIGTVSGVVTHVQEGSGFYLEDVSSPADPPGSRALFIADRELAASVQAGQSLTISGLVIEQGEGEDTLTALADITGHRVCAERAELPLTPAGLPMNDDEREALEGMRVIFSQPLALSDHYNLHAGELTLSSNGILRVPTEVRMPGPPAMRLQKENRGHSLAARLPGTAAALAVGSPFTQTTGVMGHDGRQQRLLLDAESRPGIFTFDPVPPAAESAVRIVNSNLLNFFNGDGRGGGFPGARGAESPQAFETQKARTRAAMTRMQPDLLAVQELENDGFGPHSAAVALLALLNETGHADWRFIDPGTGPIGGDVITVGLFYRSSVLEPVGPAAVLEGSAFKGLSREPLAQRFRDVRSGAEFLAVANHLKSKGRCPRDGQNADRQDGQGCWNAARVAAVEAQLPAWEKLAAESGTDKVIILGDMNAWRNEDPIRKFKESGYIDLVEVLSGLPQHSFLYWGQTGTLDYAFASPSLAARATHARNWNINALWPRNMEMPRPWLRFSDHDPVIVDFDFSQVSASD